MTPMGPAANLVAPLVASRLARPDAVAVVDTDGSQLTYAELDDASSRFARLLQSRGVGPGERVGIVANKSARVVVAIFGVLKARAAYVPVDVHGPVERAASILRDCDVSALVASSAVRTALAAAGLRPRLEIDIDALAPSNDGDEPLSALDDPRPTDLAYVLYTSGSTGVPKGVPLTHDNATSFVDWATRLLAPTPEDRFSSHAPFHFDLSVLDLYVPIGSGGRVCLIDEVTAQKPKGLAKFIVERGITVWYSTPSILTLLLMFGEIESIEIPELRAVLFAGEVFPIKHLRRLRRLWQRPVFYNLYGPTETNVCTFARVPSEVPDDRNEPYPIGFPCEHCAAVVLDADGAEVPRGGEGLLHIAGRSVFGGYFGRPDLARFRRIDGRPFYDTGDVVRWVDGEGYRYLGRRDRMVKRRGYRIELGEIERAVHAHPCVAEAAVIAIEDGDGAVKIAAFIAPSAERSPTIIELKQHCAAALPPYMSPDIFVVRSSLPKTSTDKIDYQGLRASLSARTER
jgi:amino acid adenylation domain-containing protein